MESWMLRMSDAECTAKDGSGQVKEELRTEEVVIWWLQEPDDCALLRLDGGIRQAVVFEEQADRGDQEWR